MGRAARLLASRGDRGVAAAPPGPPPVAERWPRIAGDTYSRRVALLRRVLPAVGLGLLLLVAAWPRLEPLLDDVRFAVPSIDRRDAWELRMINPRYAGIDRLNRPYVLTAAAGRQMPERNDLMSLDRPRGQIIVHGGAKVVLTAATGVYQSQARLLDLFDDVTLTHENGTRFVTRAAHIDLAGETAGGQDPVAGEGPSGDITAQGFRILNKGDTIVFTGRSHLLLKHLSASRAPPPPPALPAPVAKAAGEIAAAAAKHDQQLPGATDAEMRRYGG
jgi:lipopolysaccharide export system protein LptC